AGAAERILVELAGRAGVAEVGKAGRFLRAVLDPDGADDESQADHGRRFLRVRPTGSGGLEGEFRLPREAGARLRALLDAYARPKVEGDERPLRVRNVDAFIALLEQQISTELLVLVNAESLPDDHPAKASPVGPEAPEPGSDDAPGPRSENAPGSVPGEEREPGPRSGLRSDDAPGWAPEPDPAAEDEPVDDPAGWAGLGERVDRLVPGLLLATGQLLPVREIHRLARTSSLVRLVMDADGQVLDMGRAVRLATKAQRKAVFARYATCWVQGCPLPAMMCQIDHADNWSDGGHTDLRLLGPACQFHNRVRYRRPHHYQRRKAGKDRWAFTYTARTTGQRINHPTRT
ncbi:HNH endonuclease signature motif containing protein, partial [Planotetraspora phitsanulokensis]|uniref:HNH endonuclease signature motif containing protein n=1 Tax=Planotetraspora phitsanulokensis TaxID=575192 RepID=UPI0031EFD6F8